MARNGAGGKTEVRSRRSEVGKPPSMSIRGWIGIRGLKSGIGGPKGPFASICVNLRSFLAFGGLWKACKPVFDRKWTQIPANGGSDGGFWGSGGPELDFGPELCGVVPWCEAARGPKEPGSSLTETRSHGGRFGIQAGNLWLCVSVRDGSGAGDPGFFHTKTRRLEGWGSQTVARNFVALCLGVRWLSDRPGEVELQPFAGGERVVLAVEDESGGFAGDLEREGGVGLPRV